ncbi:FUSC family protein [Clostridium sp.]|uniref:FUSC family protein n=1 Tax=Clostridium sp. TaxID=1506 RepID=UPI002FC7F884
MNWLVKAIKDINYEYMLKNGSIMLLTLVLVYNLVGPHYIMVTFPLTLLVNIIAKQNFKIKVYSKVVVITLVSVLIVIVSFIGGLNIYIGIGINLIALFTLMFCSISPYNINFYKPYLMLYVFTQYTISGVNELWGAVFAVVLASVVVVGLSFILNYKVKDKLYGLGFKDIFEILNTIIINKINKKGTEELETMLQESFYNLSYSIYIARHKKYLGTVLSDKKYKIYILLKEFSYFLIDYNITTYEDIRKLYIYRKAILEIINYLEGDISQEYIVESIKVSLNKEGIKDIGLISIIKCIIEIQNIPKKDINKINTDIKRSEYDSFFSLLKHDYKYKTIRYRFSMRMAIALTISLFFAEILDFYKIIWGVITIFSILQPYYEETKSRTIERLKANVIAIIIVGIILNVTSSDKVAFLILVFSLYMIFAYKSYYRLSIFTSIASMSISSIVESVNVLIIYRIGYIFIGIALVMFFNKYVYPYKIVNGASDLMKKILRFNRIIIKESIENAKGKNNSSIVSDLVVQISLYNQKLYIRNQGMKDEYTKIFILTNDRFVSKIGYNSLQNK